MQVKSDIILTRLGIEPTLNEPTLCPVHGGNTATLITRTDDCGDVSYHCNYPTCGFSGDTVALLAATKKITAEAALALLKTGEFSDAFESNPAAVITNYIENHTQQRELMTYLNRCHMALRNDDSGFNIRCRLEERQELGRSSARIPWELGVLLLDDMPPALQHLRRSHDTGIYTTHAYTFNGTVTAVAVRRIDDPLTPTTVVPVTMSHCGVFMASTLSPRSSVFVIMPTPGQALTLYHQFASAGAALPAMGSILDLPLSPEFRNISRIVIVDDPIHGLTLDKALQITNLNEHIFGCRKRVTVHVRLPLTDLAHRDILGLMRLYTGNDYSMVQLDTWIIQKLHGMLESGLSKLCALPLTDAKLSPETLLRLQAATASTRLPYSESQRSAIVRLLNSQTETTTNVITLASGQRIQCLPSQIAPAGAYKQVLLNAGLVVNSQIITADTIKYQCTVTTADSKIPALDVEIPAFVLRNVSALRQHIATAFLRRGHSVYVAGYTVRGYSWPDIFAKLAEGRPVYHELAVLGRTADGDINLPYCRISGTDITPQQQPMLLRPRLVQLYSGIRAPVSMPDTNDCKRTWKQLLDVADHGVATGITVGLLHLYYCILSSTCVRRGEPSHLIYVSRDITAAAAIRYLNMILSGSDAILRAGIRTLNALPALGDLPAVLDVALATTPQRWRQLLTTTAANVVTSADIPTTALLTGLAGLTFVSPTEDETSITPELLVQLNTVLAPTLVALARQFPDLRSDAVAGMALIYQHLCDFAGATAVAAVLGSIGPYYQSPDCTALATFFYTLRRIILADAPEQHGISIVDTRRSVTARDVIRRGPHIILGVDTVMLRRDLPMLLRNSAINVILTSANVDVDLQASGLLRPPPAEYVSLKNYWTIDLDTWNQHVLRLSHALQIETSSQPQQRETAG